MLVIDVLLLLGGAVLVVGASAAVAAVVDKKLKKRREKKLDEAKGKRNAELALLHEHSCLSCQEYVDPEVDIFDHGAWWHRACWKRVMNGDDE